MEPWTCRTSDYLYHMVAIPFFLFHTRQLKDGLTGASAGKLDAFHLLASLAWEAFHSHKKDSFASFLQQLWAARSCHLHGVEVKCCYLPKVRRWIKH